MRLYNSLNYYSYIFIHSLFEKILDNDGYYQKSDQFACPRNILQLTNGNTITEAKDQCNSDNTCKGILDGSCDGKNLFLCENITSDFPSRNGCVYLKGMSLSCQ